MSETSNAGLAEGKSTGVNEAREIGDAAELLGLIELRDIVTYELHAVRVTGDSARKDSPPSLQILFRAEAEWLETRLKMTVETAEASIEADIAGLWALSTECTLTPGAQSDFVRRIGVMAVYPYLREAITTSASRLGVPAPVIALITAGQIELGDAMEDELPCPLATRAPEPQPSELVS